MATDMPIPIGAARSHHQPLSGTNHTRSAIDAMLIRSAAMSVDCQSVRANTAPIARTARNDD
jgi:hypothetical protein